jgi:hypothetical protein
MQRGGVSASPRLFQNGGSKVFRKSEISPYTVEDKVTFRNVDKTLTLYVRGDASTFVVGLKKAQDKLQEITDESDECERVNCARFFAKTLFGEEQADRLVDFYQEPLAVITVCGMYFKDRLSKKITKAQKKK